MKKLFKKSIAFTLVIAMLLSCMAISVSASTTGSVTDTLQAGSTLRAGQFIRSTNGKFTAIMQLDGNFVIYHGTNLTAGNALFATMTNGVSGGYFALQTDGNLVIYDSSNKARWSPNIHGKGATKLVMQNDGNLVALKSNGDPVWSSCTAVGDKDSLFTSQTLRAGESLISANGKFHAIMQSDGNFVIYNGATYTSSNARWSTKTNSNNSSYFTFQTDGNLVVYNQSNKAVWSPNIHGKGATRLVMQNDGNLVAYAVNNKAIWASNTSNGTTSKVCLVCRFEEAMPRTAFLIGAIPVVGFIYDVVKYGTIMSGRCPKCGSTHTITV